MRPCRSKESPRRSRGPRSPARATEAVALRRRDPRSVAERRAEHAAVDDRQVVLDAALRFLEARQRSTSEVRRRLVGAGYREELVAGAIEQLTDLGMLDDAAFSVAWIESRDRARPRGERALAQELRLKGIDREVVASALDLRRSAAIDDLPHGTGAHSADEAAATRLIARNVRALDRIGDPRARRQRAHGLLARNGFSPEVCARVAAHVSSVEDDVAGD